ncbi:hypothetical protein BDW74DRAFT_178231 [Aspergillus multicolor]|uniref:DUF4188 domain-containing protein n=1 Tax=Aspergillus multicolor TaxID=41759 RepID=UPI003CCE1F1D
MSNFKPLLPPQTLPGKGSKSPVRIPIKPPSISAMIRETMTLSTWLLIGAVLQGLAIRLFGLVTLFPTASIVLYRVLDHLLMTFNITHNRYMSDVLRTKVSGQYPQSNGEFTATPAAESIVVFHLGARSNHPLGILAPGMLELTKQVKEMVDIMTGDIERYGVLGLSQYIKVEDAAGNESMFLFYLRDYESLHRFAHDEIHMKGLAWWARIVKDHPHIAIFHETYVVPKGAWENIYINSAPTGMGDTWFPVREGEKEGVRQGGITGLVRSAVDARGGVLRSASKRLQMKWLEEAEEIQGELYDQTFVD